MCAYILKTKNWGRGRVSKFLPLNTMFINKCSGNSLSLLSQISIFKIFLHIDHMMFVNSKNVLTYCLTDNLIEATSIFRRELSHVCGILLCFRKVFSFTVKWPKLSKPFDLIWVSFSFIQSISPLWSHGIF